MRTRSAPLGLRFIGSLAIHEERIVRNPTQRDFVRALEFLLFPTKRLRREWRQ